MPVIPALTTFADNTYAQAAQVNANNSSIRTTMNTWGLFTDVAANISAVHTFDAAPVLSLGATVTAGGFTVTAGGVTVTAGGLAVAAGGAAIVGNSAVTGNLNVSGTISAAAISGTYTVPVANVVPGTFAAGTFTAPATSRFDFGAGLRIKSSSGGVAGCVIASDPTLSNVATNLGVDGGVSNTQHVTLNGNLTLSLSGGITGQYLYLLVIQDATGSRVYTLAGVTGTQPAHSTTPGYRDIYHCYCTAPGSWALVAAMAGV